MTKKVRLGEIETQLYKYDENGKPIERRIDELDVEKIFLGLSLPERTIDWTTHNSEVSVI